MPDDLAPLRRLLAHLLATDPERFWVATKGDDGADGGRRRRRSASRRRTVREGLWFLAMLFVDPAAQAAGIGQALMDRAQAGRDVDPGGPAVPGPDEPLDIGHPHLGHVHRRRPADLERALRAAGHGAAHPGLAAVSARCGAGPPCRRCPQSPRGGAVRGGRPGRARRPAAARRASLDELRPRADRRRAPRRPRVPAARGPVRVPGPRARAAGAPGLRLRIAGRPAWARSRPSTRRSTRR